MVSAGDFRNGITFEEDGNVFQIVEFQHVKPGKGAAFVRVKMKNVVTGAVTETSFNPTAKFEEAFVERREMQYLYNEGDLYYFMDNETFEQIPLNESELGDAFKFVKENEVCKGVAISDGKTDLEIYAKHTVVATGRRGADWLEKLCAEHNIAHAPGTVDIGVRVEVRNEVMEMVNRVLYESKLVGYPKPFKNKVRTFCQNPGGFVSQENYDNNLAVVNGHSYKEKKSDNTNLSILCSHNFSVPFNQPIAYAQKVGELTNMLANGQILVQRFGDILDGKRTWQKELAQSNIRPTLPDAVAGDITAAMPYRAMTNIINFIQAMDYVVPGFAAYETLLYSPELKFYSNRVKMDTDFNTSLQGLHCLGDSSGWTRGLMMASVMGVLMGRKIAEEG